MRYRPTDGNLLILPAMTPARVINRQWIESRLKMVGKSKSDLATAIGSTPPRVSELLRGDRGLKAHEAASAAQLLRAPIATVMQAFGVGHPAQNYGKLLVTCTVDASSGEIVERIGMDSGVLDEIDAPFPGYAGWVARIKGDSMAPRFRNGEMVGFTPDGEDPARLLGREAVICTSDGRMLLKVLSRGTEANRYTLISLNPGEELIQNVAIAWVARIDWHIPSRS